MIEVAHLIRPAAGGMRKHFILLLKGLSTSYRLTAYIPADDFLSQELKKAGLTYKTIPFPSKGTIGDYYQLSSHLAEEWSKKDFDLFHFHGYRAALVGSLAIRKLEKGRAVATIHNFPPTGLLNRFSFMIAKRIIASNCQNLIFVSQAVREAWSLAENKLKSSVIYNGVSEEFFETEVQAPLSVAGEKKEIVVAYIGRLSKEKGVDVFLKAAALLKNEPDLSFLIVGEGGEKSYLVNLSLKLGLKEKINFLNFQPDLKTLLKNVDVVVIPSRQEAFSLLAVEALALGKPVIASKVGGLPEALGSFGTFFPPEDYKALAQKIKQVGAGLSTFPAEEARQWVQKNFPLSKMVSQVEQVYRKVVEPGV